MCYSTWAKTGAAWEGEAHGIEGQKFSFTLPSDMARCVQSNCTLEQNKWKIHRKTREDQLNKKQKKQWN